MGAVTGDAQQRARPEVRTQPPAELQGVPAEPPGDPQPAGLQAASVPGGSSIGTRLGWLRSAWQRWPREALED